jgi:spermidine synthase
MNERIFEPLNATSGAYFDGTRTLAKRTAHQQLEVFETADLGRLFKLDGYNMVSERDEFFYHENLVHPAAIAHPAPRRALILGGGDGGTAEEVLKHNSIQQVRLAELDADVVALAKAAFESVHRGAFSDPRLEIAIDDGFAHLQAVALSPPEFSALRYDLIFFDLTDPVGPSENLYTEDTFRLCRAALNEGGALALHMGSPFAHPDRVAALYRTLSKVFACVAPYTVHIPMYGSIWALAVASQTLDPRRLARGAVGQRIANRGLSHLQFYNADTHAAVFALPNYLRASLSGATTLPRA